MGSNGTRRGAARRRRRRGVRARRGVARKSSLARSPHRHGSAAPRTGGLLHPASSAAHHRDSLLVGSPSRSRRGQRVARRGDLQQRTAPLPAERGSLAARLGLLLLHQRRRRPRSSSTCRRTTSASGRRSLAMRRQFGGGRGCRHAAEHADLPDSSSKAATRSSARWPAWRGPRASWSASRSCGRACSRAPHERRHRLLRVDRRQRHHRDRAGEGAGGARPPRPHPEQRHAVPPGRLPARAVVSPGRDAQLSAVSRAAVPAVAGEQDRAGVAGRAARYRPRALRRPARRRPPTWRGRFSPPRRARTCRASSRRCTAPTSRCSAATRRTPRRSPSASSSRTASPTVSESLKADTYRELGVTCDIRVIPQLSRLFGVHRRRGRRRASRAAGASQREAADSRVELPAGEAGVSRRRGVRARASRGAAKLLMVGDGPSSTAGVAPRPARLADDVRQ